MEFASTSSQNKIRMETVGNSYQDTSFDASRNQKSNLGVHNAYKAENYSLTSA